MRQIYILILYISLPLFAFGQQYTEYNRKGDDAILRHDYSEARMAYGEGIEFCDLYSIQGLTNIWKQDESMRPSMRNLMRRCFNCLLDYSEKNDTTAIKLLIDFYSEGIGTVSNTLYADTWKERLHSLRPKAEPAIQHPIVPVKEKEKLHFFGGYAFSIEAPYGITLGMVRNRFGFYGRYKTNFSNYSHKYECFVVGGETSVKPDNIPDKTTIQSDATKSNKKNTWLATAGFIYKVSPWLYASAGAGYGERVFLSPFEMRYDGKNVSSIWCKNLDASYKGVVVEVDAILKYKSYFLSVGCHTMNFEYIDVNAGIGVFF